MHISEFDYDLPSERIARMPAEPRDASRLMVVDAASREISDSQFSRFPEYLGPSDILVLNDTRVIRARTHGRLERGTGGSREIEVFFAEPRSDDVWDVLCKPGRRIRPGDRVVFGDGEMWGEFQETAAEEIHRLKLHSAEPVIQFLERRGDVPLPPYIDRPADSTDPTNYQTVFASHAGAVAAPTAGLHFTRGVLESIEARGVEILYVTLHVGIGTFLPIRTENPEEHVLKPERFEVSAHTAERLQKGMREGRRIVAVGTTTTRTLEFLMREYGEIRAGAGRADLYILPGFEFRIVSALLTNFHLPKSTLLMLVCAFAGKDLVFEAYSRAIRDRYRFYSYGDCMLLKSARSQTAPPVSSS